MHAHLQVQLTRLDGRIEREIRRLRARYQLSLDEFRGLYVSDEQVDELVSSEPGEPSSDPSGPGEPPADGACKASPRWQKLVESFELTPLDENLLFIAVAPELDPKYETLYAYLNNDITRKWPTADLARRLLPDLGTAGAIVGALAATAALRARHLVRRIEPPAARPTLLNTGYGVQLSVSHWLHGVAAGAALDTDAMTWFSGEKLPRVDEAAQGRAEPIARLVARAHERTDALPLIALMGQPGSGRTSTAVAVARASHRPFVRLDLSALLRAEDELCDRLERLTLALTLEPAIVLIEGFDSIANEDPQRSRGEAHFHRALAQWPAWTLPLLRTSDGERFRVQAATRRLIEVRCGVEGYAERLATWRGAAGAESIEVSDTELQSLAGRFALSPGQVRATLATARDLCIMHGAGEVKSETIATAARLMSDQALGRLATKVERCHGWSELVLPANALRRLQEFSAAVRQRHLVYGEWGFGDRIITGVGIKALFAGVSGTGKTMAAGVIARELGLELYKIDLSGVVSKYIGETEKNLDRIFRAARTANAIVFLDEAEAILGKRSEVKDAHDRYANIEVAYLLQKLEEHDGIVILATNLKRNIDDAFNRRMQYVIDFPRPDPAERERIWRGMFPPRSPLGTDIDFAFLARHFDLAGGDIRNVALDAAFLAASDGRVIGMRVIVDALSRQLAKQGKTPTGADFRQYQRLLPSEADRQDVR